MTVESRKHFHWSLEQSAKLERRDEKGIPNVAYLNDILTAGWKRFLEEERVEVRRLG
jgi:hypothetical protein